MYVIETTGHETADSASKVLRNLVLQTCCRICRISGEVKLAQLYAISLTAYTSVSASRRSRVSRRNFRRGYSLQPLLAASLLQSHPAWPGAESVDSRVLNPSYIDEDSFLFPMAVSHSVESLQERALVINRRQPNCNC